MRASLTGYRAPSPQALSVTRVNDGPVLVNTKIRRSVRACAHRRRNMGQEQSHVAHGGVAQARRQRDDEETAQRRSGPAEGEGDLRRHRARRSGESFKSDHSTESGGYRSGSSGYRSGSSSYRSGSGGFQSDDYHCAALYKNDHYRDTSRELYRPVKIAKERRHKVLFGEGEESSRLASYLSDEGKAKPKGAAPTAKRTGIRNYTPKILSDGEPKRIESWI
ncbi:unnamed protein product, partial [Iphiclides podalirius]